MVLVVLVLMAVRVQILVLAGEKGQVSLGALVGVVPLGAALEARDFLQGLVHHPLASLGTLGVVVLVGGLDVTEGSVPGLLLALSCFSLLLL